MSDSFSNLIFIALAIAVFVGRTILQAKKKREPPPRIPPVHFMDKKGTPVQRKTPVQKRASFLEYKEQEEDVFTYAFSRGSSEFFRDSVTSDVAASGASAVPAASQNGKTIRQTQTVLVPTPVSGPRASQKYQGQRGFVLNLNHLSPMKQAVVMAEILGTPKGML
jgi:hypothetical protein